MDYEVVIGLETHVQLATRSKIFAPSSAAFGAEPNAHIDPVTLGLPGALPVLNRAVVEYAIMLGIATGCEIRRFNRFARKHYFYPDLPKGYQISQFEEPICERGKVSITVGGTTRTIGIKRIHMEEDAGKNIHDGRHGCSLVDLNRAGVPLLEVVSDPDLRSAAEASAYLKSIRRLVRFLGISDGNMEEGSLRCDANISLRPIGSMTFGTRTEIKNINSFKFVERALEYEVARQLSVLKAGKAVEQQTLTFDPDAGVTRPMRGKEESADYRYFPDPDLPPLLVEESWVLATRSKMPKLPEECRRELVELHGLSEYDAEQLCAERAYLEFYLACNAVCENPKGACNWITTELFGLLNRSAIAIENSPVSAQQLGELIKLVDTEVISGKMAKTVFEEMASSGKAPEVIIKERGLRQITSSDEIMKVVQEVFTANPKQLAEYLAGNDKLHPFFVGQVMKASKGSANPKLVNELIAAEITARRGGSGANGGSQ